MVNSTCTARRVHYSPKPSEVVLRYRFYTKCQKEGESIPQFVAGLSQLSEECNFQELDNMLRDRLVVGCKVASIQQKLLSEPKLTFEKSLNVASAMDMASKDVEDIKKLQVAQNNVDPAKVNKLQQPGKYNNKPKQVYFKQHRYKLSHEAKPREQRCWCCGGLHPPNDCPFMKEK